MPKIVDHGREFVGSISEDLHGNEVKKALTGENARWTTTLTFRLWCTTDTGATYHRYVDITIPGGNEVPENLDLNNLNQEIQQQLDRAQADLENVEATTWELPKESALPKDPNNPNREHLEGKCWCGMTHPPTNHGRWIVLRPRPVGAKRNTAAQAFQEDAEGGADRIPERRWFFSCRGGWRPGDGPRGGLRE